MVQETTWLVHKPKRVNTSFWSWLTRSWVALIGQSLVLVRRILVEPSLLTTRAAQKVVSLSSVPITMSALMSVTNEYRS